MNEANSSGDSSELEALFDSVAASVENSVALPGAGKRSLLAEVREGGDLTEDSKELQDLFDSVVEQGRGLAESPQAVGAVSSEDPAGEWSSQQKVFDQVGHMVRQLRETLKALGYDKVIEDAVNAIPDAKDRLSYVSNLTERAASRVLNATDIANPLQEELEEGAMLLAEKWGSLYANEMSVEDFKLLASDTREFLRSSVAEKTLATKEQLLEIMMAQDFQDLTGQVIKKLIGLVQNFESQLMNILIEAMPGDKRTESVNSMLNGPVVNAEGRSDVVVTQEQVDDLLDSLGF